MSRSSAVTRPAPQDENTPPATSQTIVQRKPSGLRPPTASFLKPKTASRTSPRLSGGASKAKVDIQVQLPTSDGASAVRESDMPPTPPCSQSPPAHNNAGASSSQLAARPSSSQSLLPPAPKTTKGRQSRSPSANSSQGPRHAPQVLAARRKSSVTPSAVPAPSARRKTLTSIPAPVKVRKPTASTSGPQTKSKPRTSTSTTGKGRRSSQKRLPTPTETLETPVAPSAGDSDGEDPLLLKSAEEMRGYGEGRQSIGRSRSRSVSMARERSRSQSIAPTVDVERRDQPDIDMTQELPSVMEWRDEDLLPLGSGTIEEDLVSDFEPELTATAEEEEEDFGGLEQTFGGPDDDAIAFDFAPLQEQDSDVSDNEEEEAPAPLPQQDTPRQPRLSLRPHLDLASPSQLTKSFDLEYEVPIQPVSSSPARPAQLSSEHSYSYSRPSPFLSSALRPTSRTTSPAQRPVETSPIVNARASSEQVASEDEAEEDEVPLQNDSFDSEVAVKFEDEDEGEEVLQRSVSPVVEVVQPTRASDLIKDLPPIPRETWTRGPAYFRSSPSVSMSPVLSYSSLTATSPDLSSRHGDALEVVESEEEEEDEIILAGEQSKERSSSAAVEDSLLIHRSVSASVAGSRSRASSYTSSIARQASNGDESDASMSSPARPTAQTTMSSPRPRSIASDMHMSSPSPQRRSPVSPQFPHFSPSLNRKLPATPPVEIEAIAAGADDSAMASPSPVRRTAPPSLERTRSFVELGKQTLQGIFAAVSPVMARDTKGKGRQDGADGEQDGSRAEGVKSSTAFIVEATAAAAAAAAAATTPAVATSPQESLPDSDAPRAESPSAPQLASVVPSPAVREASTKESNLTPIPRALNLPRTTHGKPSSTVAHSARRPRPSHPTLPIVEISSTDPKAAARAAAILKLYHDYVEQGLEAPGSLLEEAGIRRSAVKGRVAESARKEPVGDVSVAESELRELLNEAEEEVREAVERQSIAGSVAPSSSGRGEQTDSPSSSRVAAIDSSSRIASPQTSSVVVEDRDWTASEWRRLEHALVEEGRERRAEGSKLAVEKVLRRFLDGEGLNREQCEGQWAWDKLVVRVTALQKRRYQDSLRRSSSRAPSSVTSSTVARPPVQRRRSLHEELLEVATGQPTASTERAISPIVKVEQLSDEEPDSDSDSDRDAEDDTFFERPRPATLQPPAEPTAARSPSLGPIRPPPALAGSRFAHLYDEPVEKPRLPSQSWVPAAAEGDEEECDTSVESSFEQEGTPEAGREPSETPSSARKLFSYIGSLVKRPTPESEARRILPLPPSRVNGSSTSTPSTSVPAVAIATERRRRSSGEGKVWSQITALEDAESSREEEERIIQQLQSAGAAKRRASGSDLRGAASRTAPVYGGAVALLGGTTPLPSPFVASGTRSGDRPLGSAIRK